MGELHEECGVVAIYHLSTGKASPLCPAGGPGEVSRLVPRMLLDLQHRGQLSAGITSYNPSRSKPLETYKEIGTVSEAFHQNHRDQFQRIMDALAGPAAIGHVRYATSGRDDVNYAHPFERPHIKKNKWFSFAFNGQLANYEDEKKKLWQLDPNSCFTRNSDSEIFMHYLCAAVKEGERDLVEVCRKTILHPNKTIRLDGAYTLVYLNALGEMFVARDPHGIKPLSYAFDGNLFAAASESVALFNLGFEPNEIKDVKPGEIVVVKPGAKEVVDGVEKVVSEPSVTVDRYVEPKRPAPCFFEWIYFANAASILDGKSVYLARHRLGETLAEQEIAKYAARRGEKIDPKSQERHELLPEEKKDLIVVPVPDTSRAAAEGMAFRLGVPCLEGLMRNRYSGRTFIEGNDTRGSKAKTKYTPLPEVLEGRRILLVEDSIVRSTTMRVLIERIKTIGKAKEIHIRVACPPIVSPCFYGIDMSTYSELFAPRHLLRKYGIEGVDSDEALARKWKMTPEIEDEMAKDLGCDSLHYLQPRDVSTALRIPGMELCQACVNWEYPTEWGCRLASEARKNFIEGVTGRTYD